eukprot:CAMPEP_0184511764 /NCGR_PEP_ID=MMETSP0198_2-20121128/2524_1 /TAXON_ID=1112570 /ORGANISM="Thraustochytrium sp., Strain LLF1b" /LENGTH=198 /DNA_ID=CAMNT_0026901749 /DNA_START=92 /DNA_END=688 /DNA_ORIENTATION=+
MQRPAAASAAPASTRPQEGKATTTMPSVRPPSRLPSIDTVKFVATQGAKAVFVQSVLLLLMWGVSSLLGWLSSSEWAAGIFLNVLFCGTQFMQLSQSVLSVFMDTVQERTNGTEASAPPRKEAAPGALGETKMEHIADKWDKWFNRAMLGALLLPLAFVYFPSSGEITELACCTAAQWALKMACFVGFPREMMSVPTS